MADTQTEDSESDNQLTKVRKSKKRRLKSPLTNTEPNQSRISNDEKIMIENMTKDETSEDFDMKNAMKALLKINLDNGEKIDNFQKNLLEINNWIVGIEQKQNEFETKIAEINVEKNKIENQQWENTKSIIRLEENLRRKNIIITGLNERIEDDEVENTVKKFFEEKLNLFDIEIDMAYRIGKKMDGKNRVIKCSLRYEKDKLRVLKECTKLKDSNIYVNMDYPPAINKARYVLRNYVKKLKNEGITSAKIKKDKIFSEEGNYYYDYIKQEVTKYETSKENHPLPEIPS